MPTRRRVTSTTSSPSPTARSSSRPSPSPSTTPYLHPLQDWITSRASELFSSIGHLLATHQIAALLVASSFICSLLAPALSLYFSPSGPASQVSIRGRGQLLWELEALKRQGVLATEDEVCWDRLARYYGGGNTGTTMPTFGRGRGKARVIRVEQVLVTTSSAASSSRGSGALSKRTLHLTMLVQKELERRLLGGLVEGLTCVRGDNGCATTSPAAWWESEEELLADEDVHKTLSLPRVVSGSNLGTLGNATDSMDEVQQDGRPNQLPLTPSSTLVGIGRDRKGLVKGAKYLSVSFFLEDTSTNSVLKGIGTEEEESAREAGKMAWRNAVRDVVEGRGWDSPVVGSRDEIESIGTLKESVGTGRRVILKHVPHLLVHSNPRLFEDFLFAVGYSLMVLYVFLTVRKINHVHSKPGLVFTGLVELVASGIMSLSVCWLFNLSVSLVPWKLIPFIVIVSGIDNMFVLVQAVGTTDFNRPVPERLATALASVGLSNTVTLLAEIGFASFLLKTIDVQVIRQLITFFAVVLVVDYFLELTFFATVLSIDIQRLELADLLHQDVTLNLGSPLTGNFQPLAPSTSLGSVSSFFSYLATCFRNRIARSSTFTFLIFINLLLYSMYGPDHFLPAFCSETALAIERPLLGPSLSAEFAASLTRGRRGGVDHGIDEASRIGDDAGVRFWKLINPANASSVHVYVEPVSVIKFYDDGLIAPESVVMEQGSGRIVHTPVWLRVGAVLVPMGMALTILYFILVYLLKDAELLDSTRSRAAKEKEERKKAKEGAGVDLVALKGRHSSDIELIASGKDVVLSWSGSDTSVTVWQRNRDGTFDFSEFGLPRDRAKGMPSLNLLAVDPEDRFGAAMTREGNIMAWELEWEDSLLDFSTKDESTNLPTRTNFGPATHLFPSPLPVRPLPGFHRRGFYSVHRSGYLVLWDCISCRSTIVISPPPPSSLPEGVRIKNFVVHPPKSSPSPSTSTTPTNSDPPLLARVYSTGQIEIFQCGSNWTEWPRKLDAQVTIPSDEVTALAFGNHSFGTGTIKSTKSVLVVGTASGLVSLFDFETGQRVFTVAEMSSGRICRLRLSPAAKSNCSECSRPINDGVNVICSTQSTAAIFRVITPPSNSSASTGSTCSTCSPDADHPTRPRSESISSRTRRVSQESLPYPAPRHGFHRRSSSHSDRPPRPTPFDGSSDGRTSAGSSRSPSPLPGMAPGSALFSASSIEPSTGRTTPPIASSMSSGGVPLFDPHAIDLMEGDEVESLSSSDWPALHAIPVNSTELGERGGWGSIADVLVGVRGAVVAKEELPQDGEIASKGWEVWTLPLCANQGSTPGISSLESLLRLAGPDQLPLATPTSPQPAVPTSLRRRTNPILPALTLPHDSDAYTTRTSFPAQLTSRGSSADLPFTRARPLVSALGNTAIAIGLGNKVAIITKTADGPVSGSRPAKWE